MNARGDDFVHLVFGDSGAGALRGALKSLGRNESVTHSLDPMNEGPLDDIDEGAACRVDWWARVEEKRPAAPAKRQLDESERWASLKRARERVVVWHSPHPAERLLALRLCWHLREQPERVYEVKLPPGSSQLPPFYGAAGIIGPDVLAEAWPTHRPLRSIDDWADEWSTIRSRRGDWIRHLVDDEIVHLPVTGYDDELLEACGGTWSSSTLVVAQVLADVPSGDVTLCWRIRELLRLRRLEGRGPDSRLGLPEEIRPSG